MIGKLIHSILSSSSALSAYIQHNNKPQIYPVVVPQTRGNTTYPVNALVYRISGGEPISEKQQYSGVIDLDFEVDLIANEYSDLQDMSVLSFTALHQLSERTLNSSPSVQSIIMTGTSEEEYEEDLQRFQLTQFYTARVFDINNLL